MPADQNAIIILVLGMGALFMMGNSSSAKKAEITKKREEAVAGGGGGPQPPGDKPPKPVSADDAKKLFPTGSQKDDRAILIKELQGLLERYRRIIRHEKQNQKQVQRFGLPADAWQEVIAIRSGLMALGVQATNLFSRSAEPGIDRVFWDNFRGIWAGIINIGERQRQREYQAVVDNFATPTHQDDSVEGNESPEDGDPSFDNLPEPTDEEMAALPENLSADEQREFIQRLFVSISDERQLVQELHFHQTNILQHVSNQFPAPAATNDRQNTAFITGRPLDSSEDAEADRDNQRFGAGQTSSGNGPKPVRDRSRSPSPARDKKGGKDRERERSWPKRGKQQAIGAGGEVAAVSPEGSPPPADMTGGAGDEEEFNQNTPSTNKDEQPAPHPPTTQPIGPTRPPPKNPAIQGAFNNSGAVITNQAAQTAQQQAEIERQLQNRPDARLQTAQQLRINLESAANYDEYERRINAYQRLIQRGIRNLHPNRKDKESVRAAYVSLRDAIPEDQKNSWAFKGVYFRNREPQGQFSKELKAQIKALPAYKVWVRALVSVREDFDAWYGLTHTSEKEIQKSRAPREPKPAGKRAKSGDRTMGDKTGLRRRVLDI